jgi:exopolysaccharide production protein ExoQ
MPPVAATIIFTIGITGLFLLDRGDKDRVTKALWIPTAWLFLIFSRPASQWLGVNPTTDEVSVYLEGSPIDRAVLAVLEAAALIVVIGRRRRVGRILRKNPAIGLFFFYAALSISWSDYPLVTAKHWIKGIGDVMMVLIVLTEPSVADAIKRLVTRLGFVLLPLSVLLIKYYPLSGRTLTLGWTMEAVGVATQKNGLGELCVILGLGLIWRLRRAYNGREDPKRRQRLLALGVLLPMVVWLLWMCNSMTSICTLSIGSVVMLLCTRPAFRRTPGLVHLMALAVPACTSYVLFFQSSGALLQGLGRDPTLTGRTDAWHFVLTVPNDRLIGAGYESFWLGPRLMKMWDLIPGLKIQEAHNGYIEMLINLGWIGVALLGMLIATGYRHVIGAYRRTPDIGSLRIALFLTAVNTGFTEAAFRMMSPPWIAFLLATVIAPLDPVRKNSGRGRPGRQLQCPQVPDRKGRSRLPTCGT